MEWLNIAAAIITVITGVIAILQYIKSQKKDDTIKADDGNNPKPVKIKGGNLPGVPNTPSNPKAITISKTPAVAVSVTGVQTFSGNDEAYQKWVTTHPQGFVVNTNTKINPEYMPLHKATCGHISNFDAREKGAFTERDFIKACSADIAPLKEWAKAHGRTDGSFTGNCKCLSGLNG